MAGLVGLTPEQVSGAVASSEAMKTGPVERAYKEAVTKKTLAEPPGLTYEQRLEIERTPKDVTPEERDLTIATTDLRKAQAWAERHPTVKSEDGYKTSQMYNDANAYYDDLYRKLQDEFGAWKGDFWELTKRDAAAEGPWKGMTFQQAQAEITKMINEDNRRIWQGLPPRYATGTRSNTAAKREAETGVGDMINSWKQGR